LRPLCLVFQAGKTAFLIAVLNGHLDVAKLLDKKGANKKAKDEVGTVNSLLNESRVCARCLGGAIPI
jgi:ankyrin repeat protein